VNGFDSMKIDKAMQEQLSFWEKPLLRDCAGLQLPDTWTHRVSKSRGLGGATHHDYR
jgi:hypothetical protein